MEYLYSKSTRGMYIGAIHKNLPADAVPVTEQEYAALLKGQEEGKEIVPDEHGKPVLHQPGLVPPT